MKVNNILLAEHLQNKMYSEMAEKRQTLGLRHFAEQIQVGHSTLSRAIKGEKTIELTTFLNIVDWLQGDVNDYLI